MPCPRQRFTVDSREVLRGAASAPLALHSPVCPVTLKKKIGKRPLEGKGTWRQVPQLCDLRQLVNLVNLRLA